MHLNIQMKVAEIAIMDNVLQNRVRSLHQYPKESSDGHQQCLLTSKPIPYPNYKDHRSMLTSADTSQWFGAYFAKLEDVGHDRNMELESRKWGRCIGKWWKTE